MIQESKVHYCLICGQKTTKRLRHLNRVHAFSNSIIKTTGMNGNVYFLKEPFAFVPTLQQIKWEKADTKEKVEKFRKRAIEVIESLSKVPPHKPMPEPHPTPGPNPEVIEYDYIADEDISFGKGSLTIRGHKSQKIFTLECMKSIEGLNHIKKDFLKFLFNKPILKFFYSESGKLVLKKSPDIEGLLNHIDAAIELYAFKKSPGKKGKRFPKPLIDKLSNEQLLNVFPKQNVDKGPYVRYLYSLHDQEYKLIPILESIGSSHEESFIFRVKNRQGRLFAVWENLNPGRATYIFRLADHKDYLAHILGYIEENESSKRLYLRVKNLRDNWPEQQLGFKGYVDHDNFEQFRIDFQYLISKH